MAFTINTQQVNDITMKRIVIWLKNMILNNGKDWAGDPFSNLKHPRSGRSGNTRLNDTGNFGRNWVEGKSDVIGLQVFDNKGNHTSGTPYEDIRMYNDRNSERNGGKRCNGNIVDPPQLSYEYTEQVTSKDWYKDHEKRLKELIEREATRYYKENTFHIKV
jgi:hypothetical protein